MEKTKSGAHDQTSFNKGLLAFIQQSPTPFHAVKTMQAELDVAGFSQLFEQDNWSLTEGGRYYVTRNNSSIVAFALATGDIAEKGLRLVGAHTDSPCLKVKPSPDLYKHGFHRLGVEVYGGVLLGPWFDRDLSMAGRVSYRSKSGDITDCLVDFKRAVGVVPSLAIHLDRGVNSKRNINKQTDLPVVISLLSNGSDSTQKQSFIEVLSDYIRDEKIAPDLDVILDYEISFYDVQPPAMIGLHEEFIAAARLDNLLSCYTGLQALLQSSAETSTSVSQMLVCTDHEEVGSASAAGAAGPMLHDCIARLCSSEEHKIRTLQRSMMVSVDNAHGLHPNFSSKHDENHGPLLNNGVVIKVNASQRYASNSRSAAVFRQCAANIDEPVQSFVVRSDMGCGSTIGPIAATELGVLTVDVGVPTFAMHSIRELAGSQDAWQLSNILTEFYDFESV